VSTAQQSLVQRSAGVGRATRKKRAVLGRKKGKIQWKKQELTKMESFFLSVAPFSDTLGMLMVTSGKSPHPVAGGTGILMGSHPGPSSFGDRPARVKSPGYSDLHEGCARLWVGLDRSHPFNPIGNEN